MESTLARAFGLPTIRKAEYYGICPNSSLNEEDAMAENGIITVVGCLKKGVEHGCLILVTADKEQYSLHGKDLPGLGKGLAVEVRGTAGGVDFCQEGTPFSVESWKWTGHKCP